MLGSPILYLKGRRRVMFELSGFHFRTLWDLGFGVTANLWTGKGRQMACGTQVASCCKFEFLTHLLRN